MPVPQLKALAKKYKLKLKTLERYWDEAKAQADKKFESKDSAYWAYVSSIVRNRASYKAKKKTKAYVIAKVVSEVF